MKIIKAQVKRLDFYQNIKDGLWLSLSESISNIELHSQTRKAMVALQTYEAGKGLTDEKAIEQALEPRVSAKNDRRGMGLTDIKDFIIENDHSLGIRSRSGFLYLKNGKLTKGMCSMLSGTQLSFKLHGS